jgi:aldose 1-epimerase
MTQIGIAPFGQTGAGVAVSKITLGSGRLTAALLTYGSILQSVRLDGVGHDLTLGSNRLEDYEGPMQYHGALVGPVANRINGARAVIDGHEYQFDANQGGRHLLHSGDGGTHARVWRLAEVTDTACTLTLKLADGEGGFPGNRRVSARWSVERTATLRLEVTVTTDAPTIVNFCNHSYWNLDGTPTWEGHRLKVAANAVTAVDADLIPTGETPAVKGTPLDMHAGRIIGPGNPAMDTNWCLGPGRESLRDVLWLTGTRGVAMTIATTEPGVQVYDGRAAIRPGHGAYEGLAIEPQFWPDAPSHPHFPQITLRPGETYAHHTEWRFEG